jgi:serine/threonine protein kinase
VDVKGNPRVAIKELIRTERTNSVAEGEAEVLEMIRESESQHLVKAIAYYQKGDDHYFMFPWAELGNLREFLMTTKPKPDENYIIWMFTEIAGLADAIEELHHYMVERSGNADANIRHGDMKPDNILCFKRKGFPDDTPRLVITDVGLAKVNNKATEFRSKTTPTAATKRYEAPELGIDPNVPRSRRFDIWSLGCIYLEIVIWLLYGPEKLQDFVSVEGSFYDTTDQHHLSPKGPSKSKKHVKVHPRVTEWISYIKEDWRCADGTAIRRLVELIATRLLIVNIRSQNDRSNPTSSANHQNLAFPGPNALKLETVTEETGSPGSRLVVEKVSSSARIRTKDTSETVNRKGITTAPNPVVTVTTAPIEREVSDPPPPRRIFRRPTWFQGMSDTDLLEIRAYAPEVREKLSKILDDITSHRIKSIGNRPSTKTPTPEGPKVSRRGASSGSQNLTWVS